MKKIIIIIFILQPFSCNMKSDKSTDLTTGKSMNNFELNESDLKNKIINKGDSVSYESLRISFLENLYQEEFLIYALIMANKYEYNQAYFDVYNCLVNVYFSDIEKIDEKTANLAMQYLDEAAQRGHDQAIETKEEYAMDGKKMNARALLILMNTNEKAEKSNH